MRFAEPNGSFGTRRDPDTGPNARRRVGRLGRDDDFAVLGLGSFDVDFHVKAQFCRDLHELIAGKAVR